MKILTKKYNQIQNSFKKVFYTKDIGHDDSKTYCPFCKDIKEKKEQGLKKILIYHIGDMLPYLSHDVYKKSQTIDGSLYFLKANISKINIEELKAKKIMRALDAIETENKILLDLYSKLIHMLKIKNYIQLKKLKEELENVFALFNFFPEIDYFPLFATDVKINVLEYITIFLCALEGSLMLIRRAKKQKINISFQITKEYLITEFKFSFDQQYSNENGTFEWFRYAVNIANIETSLNRSKDCFYFNWKIQLLSE